MNTHVCKCGSPLPKLPLLCFPHQSEYLHCLWLPTTSLHMPSEQTLRPEAGDGDFPREIHPVLQGGRTVSQTLTRFSFNLWREKHNRIIAPL